MKYKMKIFLVSWLAVFLLLPFFSGIKFSGALPMVEVKAASSQEKMDSANQAVEQRGLVPCTLSQCTFCNLLQMIERIFFWLLSLAFALAILLVIVVGFAYILSVGDSGAMSWAKEGLKLVLMGFVLCLLAWLAIHVLYTVLGYKSSNDEPWWQMKCAIDVQQTSINDAIKADPYYNEISFNDPGGRNNPIALPDLARQGLEKIPENKYFFVHGLGGQSLDQAAAQLAEVAKAAKSQNKIVFAATPYSETGVGTKLTKLTNYISNNDQKTLENFADLVLEIASKSPSLEVPLIQIGNAQQTEIANFNNIWPEDPNFYEGENSIFKTLSEITKQGVQYKETGPIIINWPEGEVPKNISNFSINLDYNEKTGKYILNLEDPVDVTLPSNISPEAARAAARDFSKVLATLNKQKSLLTNQEDFSTQLAALLTKPTVKNELTKDGSQKGNDSGVYRDFTTDENGNVEKTRDWQSSGTGLLPSGIATNSQSNTMPPSNASPVGATSGSSAANKNLEKELEKAIKDFLNQGNKGPSGKGPGGNQPGGQTPSGNPTENPVSPPSTTGQQQESGTPISSEPVSGAAADPNSMVSQVSIGINAPLSTEERGNIRNLIINIQKEENENFGKTNNYNSLNIPPEYVLCLIQAESSFNPVATSPTGAAGLGQHTDDSQMEAAQMLKKTAPEHYKELSKKYGKDLTQLMSSRTSGSRNVKNTLRRDANLAAAMTYAFVEVKARNVLKMNRPVSANDLRLITYRYVGDGNEGAQWNKIRNCMTNNSWAGGGRRK